MKTVAIEGMRGLGDSIYQRPLVRAAAERFPGRTWLSTPWPELFADLGVRFYRTGTQLRTQRLNEDRQAAGVYERPPARPDHLIRLGYGTQSFRRGSIVDALEAQLPLGATPFKFDLPDLGPNFLEPDGRPIAVIRPVTVREEWRNEARNPRPEYISWIAQQLAPTHRIVVVAHLKDRAEWLVDPRLPPHDVAFLHGELNVRQLLALIRDADLVVGGVGWIVPAVIALQTPAFVVMGGQGAHNAPEKITDPRMDVSRIGWVAPVPYCRCENMRHECSKAIPHLAEVWARFWAKRGRNGTFRTSPAPAA